jgi:hypothetical protein
MDDYTREVREWLDRRFRAVDADGVYLAHQPIYGFRAGHSEERLVERYVITWQILKALARLRFGTLLDVGGAEGYKAALARDLLGVSVRSSDLSGARRAARRDPAGAGCRLRGPAPPAGARRRRLAGAHPADASASARASTASSIAGVSRPVCVFCCEGW